MINPYVRDTGFDARAERHYDRMAADYYGWDGPEPECSNCYWWDEGTSICTRRLADLADDQDDAEAVTAADDHCDQYEHEETTEDADDWCSDDAWERRFDDD